MAHKEIKVKIDTKGTVKIEGVGFVGKSCNAAMEFLEKALGTLRHRKDKPDIYKRDQQTCQKH